MMKSLGLATALVLLALPGPALAQARPAAGDEPDAQERVQRGHESFKEGVAGAAREVRDRADAEADALQRRLGTGPYSERPRAAPEASPGRSGAAKGDEREGKDARARVDEAHEDFKGGAREVGREALDAAERARSRLQEALGTKPKKKD